MLESKSQVITCIGCPNGCQITITKTGDAFHIEGQECKRGEEYAIQEFTAPKRVLTTTVLVKNGILPLIPVRSDIPLSKDRLFDCMQFLSTVEVEAPIKMGQIIVSNILQLGGNIIASRNLEKT